jgi:quinohemoprotein ethanol dehydrogenase
MKNDVHGKAVTPSQRSRVALIVSLLLVIGVTQRPRAAATGSIDDAFRDAHDGRNWPAFGRLYGEQHYSPLTEINATSIGKLRLAWSLDLDTGNSVTGPVEVEGVIYFASGRSIVHAVEAVTGKLLWIYDPKVAEVAGLKLRQGWGSRGIAYWNGKVYTGTLDGRLIAIDVHTGKPVWSTMTMDKEDVRYITGPPRAFDGKVIIGHGGADIGPMRGYVTTYDAETGKQLWRFYTVPGNPADGFENDAMAMAAKTWSGEWWKFGGGGSVWNAMTYDVETDSILLGTGNGFPWNHKIRSLGKGDNLFVCSIVALDAKTGKYKWHYQFNPGESWDYNAAMDMELADLQIGGKLRKVVMTAPKNGFFYVIDRTNGHLLSAEPIVHVNWAHRIDLKTGRPVENPEARYPNGHSFTMWPGGALGAHSWLPMAYSAQTGLVYIPTINAAVTYSDKDIDRAHWKPLGGETINPGVNADFAASAGSTGSSTLLAWNPILQKAAWRVPTPNIISGGVMATAGNLVFQGHIDGTFNAYVANDGKLLWTFQAHAPVMAPPITYSVGGRQYVTVLTGNGTGNASFGPLIKGMNIDYRTQLRRVLTFTIGGTATLPDTKPYKIEFPNDPNFKSNPAAEARGEGIYDLHCLACHGIGVVAEGNAPDLRASAVPQSAEAFAGIVHEGNLLSKGMPSFTDVTAEELDDLRQFLRARTKAERSTSLR